MVFIDMVHGDICIRLFHAGFFFGSAEPCRDISSRGFLSPAGMRLFYGCFVMVVKSDISVRQTGTFSWCAGVIAKAGFL